MHKTQEKKIAEILLNFTIVTPNIEVLVFPWHLSKFQPVLKILHDVTCWKSHDKGGKLQE